ncbi:MAG TPA: hypothetical protein PLR75_01555 [Candidatus Pacearchaeota archaeon]|nr:hypothetical protein [Candidatus Pacearchaeota archaeon]
MVIITPALLIGGVMASINEIDCIASHDEEMRIFLHRFCSQVIELGELIDKEIGLLVKLNWFEKHFSWLPFMNTERSKEYRECVTRNYELRKSISFIYDLICSRLDVMVESLELAVKNTDRAQNPNDFAAVSAVLEAFKEFDHKFRCYNWFFRFGRNESQTSFRDRYPDARAIYQQAILEVHD